MLPSHHGQGGFAHGTTHDHQHNQHHYHGRTHGSIDWSGQTQRKEQSDQEGQGRLLGPGARAPRRDVNTDPAQEELGGPYRIIIFINDVVERSENLVATHNRFAQEEESGSRHSDTSAKTSTDDGSQGISSQRELVVGAASIFRAPSLLSASSASTTATALISTSTAA